jgi:hypothetical protein
MVHLVGKGAYKGVAGRVLQSQHQVAAANNPAHREAAEGIERVQPFSGFSFHLDLLCAILLFSRGDGSFKNRA